VKNVALIKTLIYNMRRTKIVCTIGPKTATKEMLLELAKGGMNVVRLNMSHGTHEWHGGVVDLAHEINKETEYNLSVMIDTKGPEIRSGDLKKPIEIAVGDEIIFTVRREVEYPANTTEINYDGFIDDVEVGDVILVDSGMINLEVVKKTNEDVICKSLDNGILTSRRHLNIRGKSANLPPITDKDWADIDFGIAKGVDYFALSFVNDAPVVEELRSYIKSKGSNIQIISKIESTDAVKNMHAIVEASDAVMIARGDLGAELPVEEVPLVQTDIVNYCRKLNKPVITATQLLESMMVNPTPTRAEVTDIFYAVKLRTDAIMMSGETANGNHPLKALDVMDTVSKRTERTFFGDKNIIIESSTNPKKEMALGAAVIANNIEAKAILAFSETGETARLLAQCRPNSPIYGFAANDSVKRLLSMSWGIEAHTLPFNDVNPEDVVQTAIKKLISNGSLVIGDKVVVVSNILSGDSLVHAVQVREVK
jgi:pyruvate kinase